MSDPLILVTIIISILALFFGVRYVMTGEADKEMVTLLSTAIGALITAYSLRHRKEKT